MKPIEYIVQFVNELSSCYPASKFDVYFDRWDESYMVDVKNKSLLESEHFNKAILEFDLMLMKKFPEVLVSWHQDFEKSESDECLYSQKGILFHYKTKKNMFWWPQTPYNLFSTLPPFLDCISNQNNLIDLITKTYPHDEPIECSIYKLERKPTEVPEDKSTNQAA